MTDKSIQPLHAIEQLIRAVADLCAATEAVTDQCYKQVRAMKKAIKIAEMIPTDCALYAAPKVLKALEKAITAMNNTPNFDTRIYDPGTGRNVRSYQLIPELEAVARQARRQS